MIGVTLGLCDEVSVGGLRVGSCWTCHIEGDVVRVMVLGAVVLRYCVDDCCVGGHSVGVCDVLAAVRGGYR